MFTKSKSNQILTIVVALTLLFSAVHPSAASAQGGDGVKRQVNPQSGRVSFIGPETGRALSASRALGTFARPQDPAMALADRFAPEFGLKNPARDLSEMKAVRSEDGRVTVRYQQKYNGVPVMGGELIVNTNDRGDLYSMNGEVSADLAIQTAPTIDSAQAAGTALQAMAKWYQRAPEDFAVSTPELWIYDESLLRPSTRPVELVWRMEVTARDNAMPVRELILVNAERGGISLHFNQIDTAWTGPDSVTVPPSGENIPALAGITLYVSTTGNDTNSCLSPSLPCLTIDAAIGKSSGSDTIKVASGTYTGTTGNVVTISKSMTLSGGWNSDFTAQNGVSVIDGGGVRNGILANNAGSIITVEHFVVRNSASSDSGGIYLYGGVFTLKNSTLRGNIATNRGGGVFLINNAVFRLIDSTVSGNSANIAGGGIFVDSGHAIIENSTIAYNDAATGGGINVPSTISVTITTVWNSILANNSASNEFSDCSGSISMSGSIIENESGCTIASGVDNQIGIDPEIDGSLTGTKPLHLLLPNSPAIDAGKLALCTYADQRGMPRPRGNGCDVGAYEYAPDGGIDIVSGSEQTANTGSAFTSPLTVYLFDANANPVSGATVTFTAPGTGASGTFASTGVNRATAVTNGSGQAISPVFTANNIAGTYTVVASVIGYSEMANFSLTNDGGLFVATTGSDSNTCQTPSDPCATIQAAIYKAVVGNKIQVASGTYTGNASNVVAFDKDLSLSGGWNSEFTAQTGMSIIDGENIRRGVYVSSPAYNISMDHFIIENGWAVEGGGIYNYNTLTISNSIIRNNNTKDSGNGIGGDGGGIYNYYGTLTLNNTIVSGNIARFEGYVGAGGHGGGIYTVSGTMVVNNSTIENNTATYTGLSPENGGDGGGISFSSGSVTINNSIISNNMALHAGGISSYGDLTINSSTIANNRSANDGGGIYVSGGTLSLTNTTISNNTAKASGGAIYIYDGSTSINNSTITQNIISSGYELAIGGGLSNYFNKPVTIKNTIIAGNAAPSVPDCRGQITSGGYNLIGYSNGCIITPAAGDQIGTIGAPLNAKLGNLQNNGGGTPTHALLVGSPAIDAGDPTTCATIDQRGVIRPQGAKCDIGAFEGVETQSITAVARTYTAGSTSNLPGTFLCDETQPNCTNGSNLHADGAHKYAIGTYNFYQAVHNRNSIDQNNMPIISTVQYCDPNFPCPYGNAFWSGAQMVYGSAYGFALADDIVAHELTHGVIQYESNLFYYYQSGAISESFTDLWGEYYDQSNGLGNDTAGVKWLLGEDTTGLGAVRSLSNPTLYNDPDRMSSTYYYEGQEDNGGVHTNSGVNNKAVFLMVEGGTFNGKTVTALSWEKTAAIYYEVNTNLLSSGADYSDLYFALQQACANLTGTKGITSADCVEVKDALDAVEMNGQPAPNFNTDAPLCTTAGTYPSIFFADDLESGTSNWTINNGSYPRWQLDTPYGPFAQSGLHSLFADDYPADVTDASARLTSFVVPANAFLHFAHAYDFETDLPNYWDGGVLEYSINNSATWVDAGSLMTHNGYRGTIYANWNNPLKGRSAFVGTSHGYISTRLNLSTLAGKTVTFRWRMGLDDLGFAWGWWVDNVRAYTCIPNFTISGNAGASGVILSYTDGTAKTVTSQPNGTYSLPVTPGWSGTVTPTHPCYTFNPTSRPYANVTANQTGQNYTATFNPASGCANINVNIGANLMGSYALLPGQEKREFYPASGGPVKVASTNAMDLIAAIRLQSFANNTLLDYNETMGIPEGSLSTKYIFPVYENKWAPLNSQIRFAHLGTGDKTVRVTIGTEHWDYVVAQGQDKRIFLDRSGGPVIVESLDGVTNIIAAIRLQAFANNTLNAYSETMGIPIEALSSKYYFPVYENKWAPLNSQIRFAHLGTGDKTIRVTIGTEHWDYVVAQGQDKRISLDRSGGPVIVESLDGVTNIIAAIRLQSFANNTLLDYNETMGIPESSLSSRYIFPVYENKWAPLNSQIRFAHFSTETKKIKVTIGTEVVWYDDVLPNTEKRLFFDRSGGPVIIESDDGLTRIVAAIRLQCFANNVLNCYSETMGIPLQDLAPTYYFPVYENLWAPLNSQVRFGVP